MDWQTGSRFPQWLDGASVDDDGQGRRALGEPAQLWSLQRQPDFRRSAGVATATYVVTLLAPVLIALGANDAPLLTAIGGLLAFVGIVWGAQAIHRVTTNIDVAAEAVYAEYHARQPADES